MTVCVTLPTARAEDRQTLRAAFLAATQRLSEPLPMPQGDDVTTKSIFGDIGERLPSVVEGRFELPPLMAATTDTENIGNGRVPEGFRAGEPSPEEPLPESAAERGLTPNWALRSWAAPNTFFNPLYFEDRMLERHGHERCGMFQPLASGVRFFATVPMLPYLMTVRPPCEAEYSLGYFRAGSPAPRLRQRPPYERRAALVEAGAIAGGIIAFP